MKILIAEDMIESRMLLEGYLRQLGHEVTSVVDGAEAYSVLEKTNINFLITDWMMPNLSGLELCRKIRSGQFDRYIYIILLTARNTRDEMIEGLDAGADDFLGKPFIPMELKSRITTGARILELEKRLEEKNHKLEEINHQLQRAYSLITKDIEYAASLQRDLIPAQPESRHGYALDWLFVPSSGVAGDIFNFFFPDEDHIVFYQLDVAGHGIASAMLSYTLSKFLSPSSGPGNLLLSGIEKMESYLKHPSVLIHRLNELFYKENDAMQFFTICYGIIDTRENKITLSRAGHPLPIQTGPAEEIVLKSKGFPVGMLKNIDFIDEEVVLQKGDRLFIYSDGIIELQNNEGFLFGQYRLKKFLRENDRSERAELIAGLRKELELWKGSSAFDDDISMLIIERESQAGDI